MQGGIGGSMGLARRPQRPSPRSRPKSSSSLVCMRDRSFFPLSDLLGCPPSFSGGVHLSSSGWNLWGRGRLWRSPSIVGFVDEKDGEDGYEKDDVRKKRGGRTEMMVFQKRPILRRLSTFEVTTVISKVVRGRERNLDRKGVPHRPVTRRNETEGEGIRTTPTAGSRSRSRKPASDFCVAV